MKLGHGFRMETRIALSVSSDTAVEAVTLAWIVAIL